MGPQHAYGIAGRLYVRCDHRLERRWLGESLGELQRRTFDVARSRKRVEYTAISPDGNRALLARRPGDDDLHPEPSGGQCRTGRHRGRQGLRVPGPGEHEALALDLPQLLPQRHGVGEGLAGVPSRRLQIDDGLLTVLSEAADDGVFPCNRPIGAAREGTDTERVGVASEHASRVVHRRRRRQPLARVKVAPQQRHDRLRQRQRTAGQHDEDALARLNERMHLPHRVHLVVTRVGTRIRRHDQPVFRNDTEAISHRSGSHPIH